MFRLRRIAVLSILLWSSTSPVAQASERPSEAALRALSAWDDHREPIDYILFAQSLMESAERVADRLGADSRELFNAWIQAPYERQVVVLSAVAQLDKPYRYASSDPTVGFDCSGLTRFAWSVANVPIPTTSRDQLSGLSTVGEALPGDIWGWPGHVMLWLGVDNYVIHAANRQTGVTVTDADPDVLRVTP